MPIIITILAIIVIKILLFSFYKNKTWYKNFSKLLQDVGVLISIAAIIYSYMQTDVSIQYAKLAIDQADESSKQSDEVARKTISLLDSISKSSSGLKGNIDSISITIKLMDKYLTSLSENISNINTFSDEQVKNLKAINTAIQMQANLLTEQNEKLEKENARRPILKLIYECTPSKNKYGGDVYKLFLVNTGNVRTKIFNGTIYFGSSGGHEYLGDFYVDQNSEYPIYDLYTIDENSENFKDIKIKFELLSDNGFKDVLVLTEKKCRDTK